MIMVILGLLSWWYGAGWQQRFVYMRTHIEGMFDYFSIDLLARTLFSPFRQIAAGSIQGPLSVQLRAFLDNIFSRIIGSVVRTLMIFVGILAIIITCILHIALFLLWPLMPLAPLAGVILAMSGWVPWSL